MFCLHIQRTGKIIKDQQRRLAHKHTGRRRALKLSTGEAHPTRADDRRQPLVKRCQIFGQDSRVQGCRQCALTFIHSQKNVLP